MITAFLIMMIRYGALFDSIKNKLLPLADDTPVFPGHGPATSIGEERTMF